MKQRETDERRVLEEYWDGYSKRAIATKHKVSEGVIERLLMRNEIPMGKRYATGPDNPKSGGNHMNERFVDFMYILMRDHIPCGIVEEICMNFVEHTYGNKPCDFSNEGLEQYARVIVERIELTADGK